MRHGFNYIPDYYFTTLGFIVQEFMAGLVRALISCPLRCASCEQIHESISFCSDYFIESNVHEACMCGMHACVRACDLL